MKSEYRHLFFAGLILLALSADRALADAIVRTEAMNATSIAEIFIEGRELRVELEIGAADVAGFPNLMPDEIHQKLGHDPLPFEERLQTFFREDLVIRADGGEPLEGRVASMAPQERIVRDDITGEAMPLPEGEAPEQVLAVRIDYRLPQRPEQLSFKPPVDRDRGASQATIGFIVYHEGVAVNDFRYLGANETLTLDWEDPWYSAFQNRNLKRQFSAPAQGFIYVEPFEVRKEILIRPKDLQHWIDLGLEGRQVIAAADQEQLKAKVAEFLGRHCPMTVDGEPVEFEFDRIHFVRRTLKKTTVLEEAEDLPVVSAMLGVIYVHRRDSLPQQAAMTWDLFNERISSVSGATHDEAGPFPWTMTVGDPVLEWTNYLKNPTLPTFVTLAPPPAQSRLQIPPLSVVCVLLAISGLITMLRRGGATPRWTRVGTVAAVIGVAALWPIAQIPVTNPWAKHAEVSDDQAATLITGLLRNIYRAFDYRDEEVVYDSLARSVSGDLLTEIYIDIHQALVLQGQGGAKVKVDTLEMLEADSEPFLDRIGFSVRCRWNVSGKVNHWGHVHTRTNQYEADFSVEVVDGSWKITRQDLVGSKRVG